MPRSRALQALWEQGLKPCSRCKETKLFSEFHAHHGFYDSHCKKCKQIARGVGTKGPRGRQRGDGAFCTDAELIDLLESGLSRCQIAEVLGYAHVVTVNARVGKLGALGSKYKRTPTSITFDAAYDLYVIQGQSIRVIAKVFGVNTRRIAALLDAGDITNHPKNRPGLASEHPRLHRIWVGMRARCRNPNQSSYAYYGGKGVTVCGEWQSFENFLAWAAAHGYAEDLSIDRIDSSGNYEPSNCRWITMNLNRLRALRPNA